MRLIEVTRRAVLCSSDVESKTSRVAGLMASLFLAAFVVYGMVAGANPNFDKGTSPASSVALQEAGGVLALAALANVIARLTTRRPAAWPWTCAFGALALWGLLCLAERAS
jgi:phage terminase large subunit-like protein